MSEEETQHSSAERPSKVKVHDKRMFTPDGRLREEYSFLENASSEPATPEEPRVPPPDENPEPPREPERPDEPERREPETPERPPLEIPPTGPGDGPSFLDLVAVLAEPASIYLQRVQAGGPDDPETGQHLELARLHIDLLDVLKTKTSGRLAVQESNVLEDALYQLRMAYVQLRG